MKIDSNTPVENGPCDRCGFKFNGNYTISDFGQVTCGYYDVTGPYGWSMYADEGEKIVCEDCMWVDPRYIAVYGIMSTSYIICK
jgi:hypothetical protein